MRQIVPGLREAGWQTDQHAITYAYDVAAALRCVLSTACWPVTIAQDESKRYVVETEQRWNRPIERIFEHWADVSKFLLNRVDAARTLLDAS